MRNTFNATVLFSTKRNFTSPFDSLNKGAKGISGVKSSHNANGEGTLYASVVDAICTFACGKGAVGKTDDNHFFAEYPIGTGQKVAVKVYRNDSTSPFSFNASFCTITDDGQIAALSKYSLSDKSKNNNGAELIFALMPLLMADEEFANHYGMIDGFITSDDFKALINSKDENSIKNVIENAAINSEGKTVTPKEALIILCDNAYRRCTGQAPIDGANINLSLSVEGISPYDISADVPDYVYTDNGFTENKGGFFEVFKSEAKSEENEKNLSLEEWEGRYALGDREYTDEVRESFRKLLCGYVVPDEAISILKHIKGSPLTRNIMLTGVAGTGKTKMAVFLAYALGLPYYKYTCSATTDELYGTMIPYTDEDKDGEDKDIDANNITVSDIVAKYNLPSVEEIEYDTLTAYSRLTGIEKENVSVEECMMEWVNQICGHFRSLANTGDGNGIKYKYVESDIIKALKTGGLVELQEPTVIVQPAVLVGLNSLLELDGSITLMTGEVINRHPEAVVVMTTNTDYEGCRNLNQSVISRMNLVMEISLPDKDELIERLCKMTHIDDIPIASSIISRMVDCIFAIQDYCRDNGVTDGSCDMRSLISWAESWIITKDVFESAIMTVIPKATLDRDERVAIYNLMQNYFELPSGRAKKYERLLGI